MSTLVLGPCSVDLETGEVSGGLARVKLSDREVAVLVRLREAVGGVVSREVLGGPGGSRAADMTVSRLRRRLGEGGAAIVTVRGRGYRLADPEGHRGGLDLGWGVLALDARQVRLRGTSVSLTGRQSKLLELLALRPGVPLQRVELAHKLWGDPEATGKVDMTVHRLRRRLELDPDQPRFVVSVRGRGLALLDARSTPSRSSPLPPGVDMVGREVQHREALEALGSDARCLLLHGPPGIGKTTLALEVARAWAASEGGEVVSVDLHGVSGAREPAGRIATGLGMESIDRDELVIRSLAARGRVLVVVDGALSTPVVERIRGWLAAVPELRVLAAARAAAPGWLTIELGPLSDAAARRVLERAAGRDLGDRSVQICHRVDGNPLALELIGAVLQRTTAADLDRRLALPLTPLRRAWKACIEELPAEALGAALAASLFGRPFVPDDLGDDGADQVDALLARSVLRAVGERLEMPHAARELLRPEARRGVEGRALRRRHHDRLLVVLDRLVGAVPATGGSALDELEERWTDLDKALYVDAGGSPEDAVRLARVGRLVGERVPRPRRVDWAEALESFASSDSAPPGARASCLRAVHALRWDRMGRAAREELLRQALRLADRPELAASIAAELASIVAFSGGAAEARRLLRAHPMPADADVGERIRRDRHVGRLAIFEGRPRQGVPRLMRAVAEAEDAGLPLLEARCRMALGQALSVGTLGLEAEHHLRRAVALSREHGLPEQAVRATLRLAQHLLRIGLRVDAAELLHTALDSAVRAGLTHLEEQCASTLGYLLIGQGRLDESLAHLDRAVALCEEHGGRRSLYVALCNRGLALSLAGRPGPGRADLAQALAQHAGAAGWYGALGLAYRAVAELLDDQGDAARQTCAEARTFLTDLDHADAEPLAEALGMVAAVAGGASSVESVQSWAERWRGGAEVEGVVLGIRRALVRRRRRE